MERTPGKGSALRAGFAAATSDIIVMLDADGSTLPGEIPIFVSHLLNGADFVKGSRFLQGGGTRDMEFHRKLGNWFFVAMVRLLFGGRYTDLCYGYNAFWTRVLPCLNLTADGFEIETMLNVRALKADLKIAEIPSYEYRRIYGTSKLSAFRDGIRVLQTIIREWSRGPLTQPSQQPGQAILGDSLRTSIYLLYSEAVALYDAFVSSKPPRILW